MANELEILTTNAAGDGWVDAVPATVSKGYQAQNTAIQAHANGEDKTYVYVSGSSVVVASGGLVDIDGLPFKITSDVTLAPASAGTWYIRVVPGSGALSKSLELTDDPGTWNAVKNGLYDGDARRVLNWQIVVDSYGISSTRYFANGFSGQLGRDVQTARLIAVPSTIPKIELDFSGSTSEALFALAFDYVHGNLIGASPEDGGRIFIFDGITATVSSSFLISAMPSDIEIDDAGNLWTITAGTIRRYTGISNTVSLSFSTPGTNGSGITIDRANGNLITCDQSSGLVYIHDGMTTSVSDSFTPAVSTVPYDLSFNSLAGDLVVKGASVDKEIVVCVGISERVRTVLNLREIINSLAFVDTENALFSATSSRYLVRHGSTIMQ